MDPRFFSRKGYDTDLLILRSLFALNPATNLPISTNYILTTDGIGGLNWESAVNYLSSTIGFPSGISTGKVSSSLITLSTMGIVDIQTNQLQILSASNGQLFLNGSPLVAGSGVGQAQLTSTVTGLGTAGYISAATFNQALTSTLVGLGTFGYVSTSFVNNSLASTVRGLGTAGYVSTSSLNNALTSSIGGLTQVGYVNTTFLADYVTNNNNNLGSLTYISSQQLFSTTASLLQYVATFPSGAQIISSAVVYGSLYLPSTVSVGVLNYFTQDVSTLSTSVGYTLLNNEYGWITSTQLFSTVSGLGGSGLVSTGQLTSSIIGLGTFGYISSPQLISTIDGLGLVGYISSQQLQSSILGVSSSLSTYFFQNAFSQFMPSTVAGLGTARYVSSTQLFSTVIGLGSAGYISSQQLLSSVAGLGNSGYLSQRSLTSTVVGLGTIGYVSTTYLTSIINDTVINLGSSNYISTAGLNNIVRTLGTTGYISSATLYSTVSGLGGAGLVSSGQLVSTVTGLGTYGYISTLSLYSTSLGLQKSFFVANTNNVYVTNSFLTISSVSNIIYLSSILLSSITYQGLNGQTSASNNIPAAQPLFFSSATLPIDLFSTYITPRSFITIDAYPTFLFSQLGLPSGGGVPIYMSTFIQNGRNYLSTYQTNTMFYPTLTSDSNAVSPSLRISVPARVLSNYFGTGNPITLAHYLPNGATLGLTQGFLNCNVTVFYGSTNSVFLSVQNLP